ncbi:Inorganic phosphate transporter pho84 [Orbilia blumenaviensis]|uniref:Inorganic phosphate transporter pho84 n=1 Tax=Orbilia blumenaviensis TaxID=1796055 RepID=A0AAV9U4Y2_9PEZI
MWTRDYRRKPLTPVREESISGTSGSIRPKSSTTSPQRGNSIELEPVRSFLGNLLTTRSQSTDEINEAVVSAFLAGRRTRFTGDGNQEEYGSNSGPPGLFGQEDPSTSMASPVIGDSNRLFEGYKHKIYQSLALTVASLGASIEGYAIFLPLVMRIVFTLSKWDSAKANAAYEFEALQLRTWSIPIFEVSIFFGMAVGSILAAFLSRRYRENDLALSSLTLVFIAHLAMVLSGRAQGIGFYPVIVFWRILVGVGIGGIRSVSTLPVSRVTNPQWRGARMGYFALSGAIGYCSVLLTSFGSVAIYRSQLQKMVWNCNGGCNVPALDQSWRLIAGGLLLSTFLAILFVIPQDIHRKTPRPILAFTPSFERFAKTYRNAKYYYPLVFIGIIQFLTWFIFYGILFHMPTILWEAGYIPRNIANGTLDYFMREYIGGMAILVGAGIGSGYILLCLLVDRLGRKTLLFASYCILMSCLVSLAVLWARIPMIGRMLVITVVLMALSAGPMGCMYIYTGEVFPRGYKVWGVMVADLIGYLGAIAGVISTEFFLRRVASDRAIPLMKKPGLNIPWMQAFWAFLGACIVIQTLAALGVVETARKEAEVIEGEVYGNWGKWNGRRMRPKQGVTEAEAEPEPVGVAI